MNVMNRICLYFIIGIGAALTIINCGRDKVYVYKTAFQVNQPESLKPYVARFQAAWGHSTGNLYIEFKDLLYNDSDIIGSCEWLPGNPHVYIQKSYWSYANEAQKEQLMFHELGHCYLLRTHREEINNTVKQAMSIMHSDRQISEGFYWLNHEYYMNELFDR